MHKEILSFTEKQARRLFIFKQHLTGNNVNGDFRDAVKIIMRDTGYIQWDPVTVVAPSHMISLWSRIGQFQWSELEHLMWNSREVFLHWTPIAFLVLTEDYPVYYSLMKEYPESLGSSWRNHIARAQDFLDSHGSLRREVVERLRNGPSDTKQFRDLGKRGKSADGWSSGNEVSTLLYHLHMKGEVMVSAHSGNQNIWSLTEDFLPDWAEKDHLQVDEFERRTAVRGLKALGIAPEFDINRYYVRGRYRNLSKTIKALEEDSEIFPVKIEGMEKGKTHYIHEDDLQYLDKLDSIDWDSNISLISPFDNIVTIRERTKRVFNFDYILEQFLPKEKRKYGTYVLPILWKDQLVGRLDAKLDKAKGVLNINSVYAEPGHEKDYEIPANLMPKLEEFSRFIGSVEISFGKTIPDGWGRYLR